MRFVSCHFPVVLAQCPLCGCGAVGLKHFVENCVAKAGLREDLDGPISLHWDLSTTASSEAEARRKILLVGLSATRAAHTLDASVM